ncbi:MAG TPA: GatB/YqeY domain-containing protein [Anaerolineaceae bacterium]|nr:GatB/YqeY domain-containing protein [Anaerolineaceae bacterium]
MTTKSQLESALKDAMRSQNDVARRTIRMVLSSVKNTEIDRGQPLDETGISAIIQKEVKIRQEDMDEARRANRPDLVQEAQDEISILQNFLPAQLTETELKELVAKIITELNATGQADIGKVMKALLPMTQGRAPGNVVNQMVREMLAG